ncbi:MAG TPA: recombinase family protein [Herpetosiphonaceae bacterium]|nr:recombinase family protein [Herpetosiphonaceae bacterium]
MLTHSLPSKIRPDHLARPALIYVRQSTLFQVREHTASTARQYDLVQRARDLGWAREDIVVIDQDQGHSGASTIGRDGFQFLIAEVGLGRAGAVLSLEVSRLARSCSDWYRLLEICALTDTLVIDEEGVYDPGLYNDRLLLGFKGTMSEAELHWLRSRLLGGKLEKAQHGELRFRPPAGLILDLAGRVVLDPDEEVQQAIRLVFDLFEQVGSALAVVKHFNAHHLRFPNRLWGKRQAGELVWGPLTHSRVLEVLHNPAYAGTYVYGRTQTRTQPLPGEAPRVKGRTRPVAREEWPIVLHDAHPGYLSWEQFLRNQQRLDDNRTFRPEERRGAVREGMALLQGIVCCGQCGRRMRVRYLADGTIPSYDCNALHVRHAGPTCQVIRGDGVDAAVAGALLEAMQPAQLDVSLATLEQLEAQARQIERQWQLRLERAQYEADLARRRFLQVEPENRLVTRSLERDWNDKLAAVAALEREYASVPRPSACLVSPAERQRILALAQDVPAVWRAPTTTQAERKQLLRFLVKDVTLTKRPTTIYIAIRWQTDACTTLEIPRPERSCDRRRTAPAVVARVRELAPSHSDSQLATVLNQEGVAPGLGGTFTASKVGWIRYAYGIPSGCPEAPGASSSGQRGDGRYSARAAAQLLNVDVSTIADWCGAGRLDFIQETAHGPRWIRLTPEDILALRKPVRQRKPRYSSN